MTTMTFDNKCFKKLHKTEAWMYTNVSALANIDFALSTTFVDEHIIHEFDVTPANSFIVLINGVFNEEASRLSDGIEINAAYELAGTIASRFVKTNTDGIFHDQARLMGNNGHSSSCSVSARPG